MSSLTAARDERPLGDAPQFGELGKKLQELETQALSALKVPRPGLPFNVLAPRVASVVLARWGRPCEEAFAFLATSHPLELLRLVASGVLDVADLTFAAEIAGRIQDPRVVRVLLPLLKHVSPVVREGALYGLAAHADDQVLDLIRTMADKDPSPGVRAAAEDVLSTQ